MDKKTLSGILVAWTSFAVIFWLSLLLKDILIQISFDLCRESSLEISITEFFLIPLLLILPVIASILIYFEIRIKLMNIFLVLWYLFCNFLWFFTFINTIMMLRTGGLHIIWFTITLILSIIEGVVENIIPLILSGWLLIKIRKSDDPDIFFTTGNG